MECELPTSRLTPVALEPLPHPVYFVYPSRSRWEELFETGLTPDPDARPHGFWDCNDCWVMLTYLHLRRRGLDVRLVERPVCEAINVITIHDLAIRSWAYDAFTVVCRNDSFRPMICAHTIVQNPYNAHTTIDHLVQHWPQPGLLPREASRGTRVENIVYKGDELNLWEGFRSPEFVESLRYWLGVSFRCDGKPEDKAALRWHDYQDADVVLAVRDLTEADYRVKPASKLINAWHAGVPALLGPEPAYRALRRTELDYIEVRTPDEAIGAIRKLKESPELYRAMVENGLARCPEFSVDAIAARWRAILAGPVARGYERWRRPSLIKRFYRLAKYAAQSTLHKYEILKYVRERDHGYRPISGRNT